MSYLKIVKAKMFWRHKGLKKWIENEKHFIDVYGPPGSRYYYDNKELKSGILVGQVLPDRNLTEEQLIAICTKYCRSDKYVRFLLKPSRMMRYLVIFGESPYLHVYFEDHIGVVLFVD